MAAGLLGLVVLAMLGPIIATLLWLDHGRPLLYWQRRVGLDGRDFWLVKFRTLANGGNETLPLARLCRYLRHTHLDELPQFLNVLAGTMSVVGPRPERPEIAARITRDCPSFGDRTRVKPGLTGWAYLQQGSVGALDDPAGKLRYDLEYIARRSLRFDLWIITRTAARMLGLLTRQQP